MRIPGEIMGEPGRTGEVRAYRQIAELLRDRIGSGALPPGQPAPSITVLAREHGHARQTCAKALRLLEREGLLARVPGLGYYVRGRA